MGRSNVADEKKIEFLKENKSLWKGLTGWEDKFNPKARKLAKIMKANGMYSESTIMVDINPLRLIRKIRKREGKGW